MPSDFLDYELPPQLIAQEPSAERDGSRLLVVHRSRSALEHRHFFDLPALLNPGDLLVLNDTRVLAARLLGRRTRTGGKWEGLVLGESADGCWELLSQTRGRLVLGETLQIEPEPLRLSLVGKTPAGRWLARPSLREPMAELLARHGHVPIPPYIRKGRAKPGDAERYQTVYARQAGAVAAPTAGLHFTPRIFDGLRQRGVDSTFVTLHVGLGTFQPIQTPNVRDHRMHAERGEVSAAAAEAMNVCRARGGRIVAVGTTTVRLLETAGLKPWSGSTDLYIHPPFTFRAVDALVTNFHLPRSTLLLLVGAFAGVDLLREAYRTAVEMEYRFYSYGDAMLIL